MREFFSVEIFSPGWISVRLLAWMSAAAAAVAATLMWLNLNGFPAQFDESAARRFAFGAGATTASAAVLLGLAIAHYSFGRRGSRVGAALLTIAITGSLALPIAARGAGGESSPDRGRGGSRSVPRRRARPRGSRCCSSTARRSSTSGRASPSGRLPNFGRLLDAGASMDLATIRPTQPDPVWTAVATGMYPVKNGVRSAASYFACGDDRPIDLLPDHCFSHVLVRLGVVRDQPNSSAEWRARPLWTILGDYGISRGHRALAADVSGAAARRVPGHRSLSPDGRVDFENDERSVVSARHPVDRRATRSRASSGTDSGTSSTAAPRRGCVAQHPVQLGRCATRQLDTAGHYYLR